MMSLTGRYKFVRLPGGGRKVEATDLDEAQAGLADRMEEILLGVEDGIKEARRSGKYTGQGIAELEAQLKAEARQKIDAAEAFYLRPLQPQIDAAGAAMLAPQVRQRIPDGVDRDDWRMAESEVRRRVYDMKPHEVESLYLAACDRGDVQTIRALELAPAAFPILNEQQIEKGRVRFARAAFGNEKVDLLGEIEGTQYAMKLTLGQARRHLGHEPEPAESAA